MAVDCVEVQSVENLNRMFHLTHHDFNNVSSDFKQPPVKRTGHARFRRGPPPSATVDSQGTSISSQSEEKRQEEEEEDVLKLKKCFLNKSTSISSNSRSTSSLSSSSSSSSIMSSVIGGGGSEGSVSNGKQLGIVAPAPMFSSRKPPLPSTHRKRCSADRPVIVVPSVNHGSGSGCHCCKRRKIGSKREIRRVPIIGSKVTSIPADDFSWKKYGEKKIDGSPYPRVYYKCNTGKGCPARKRVELALDDSKMLLVTYDGEHQHRHYLHRHRQAPTPVPLSLTGVAV